MQQRLQKIGVDRALARAGARDGDVVRIGDTELEYEEGSMSTGRMSTSRLGVVKVGTSSVTLER